MADEFIIKSWYARLGLWRCRCGYRFLAGGGVPKHDGAINGFGCLNRDLAFCQFDYHQASLALIKALVNLTTRVFADRVSLKL